MKFVNPQVLALMLPAQRRAIPRNRYGAAQFVRKLAQEAAAAARGTGRAGQLTNIAERDRFAKLAQIYAHESRRLMAVAPIRDREAGPSVYVAYKDKRAERPSAALFAKMAERGGGPPPGAIVRKGILNNYGADDTAAPTSFGNKALVTVVLLGIMSLLVA